MPFAREPLQVLDVELGCGVGDHLRVLPDHPFVGHVSPGKDWLLPVAGRRLRRRTATTSGSLRRACGIQSRRPRPRHRLRDRVHDPARQRAGADGPRTGIDVSAPAIEQARELAHADKLRNVAFTCGDAQVHRFPPEHFDLVISRFGTMFFQDPAAAFANIGQALCRGWTPGHDGLASPTTATSGTTRSAGPSMDLMHQPWIPRDRTRSPSPTSGP